MNWGLSLGRQVFFLGWLRRESKAAAFFRGCLYCDIKQILNLLLWANVLPL